MSRFSILLLSIAVAQVAVLAESTLAQIPPNQDGSSQIPSSQDPQNRARRSYFGIGVGVGLGGGETGLSDGGISTVGRIGLTDNLSVHTASVIGDKTTLTVALTGGVPIRNKSGRVIAYPFIGGGVSANTSDNFEVDPLLTAGVDVPLAKRFTATGRVGVGFGEKQTDVGLIFGVGFSF